MWLLENKYSSGERMSHVFSSRIEAETYLKKLGPIISNHYQIVHESGDAKLDHMLTEGLVKGDLYNILLPRISIDEYVPADPETDNVVIAFFVKGEQRATIPLKNFADHSRGVLSTDYGDSETVVNTQIVYIEFDRENLELDDIRDLMVQISMLSGLDPEDFTMTFPHTNKKFPYDIELMGKYFKSRTEKKNRLAQEKAEKERQKRINKRLKKIQAAQRSEQMAQEPKPETEEQPDAQTPAEAMGDMPVKESLAERLASVPFV